ncbi:MULTISPECIES: TRAP transporter large permease [Metabacillus]|jgi:TRAP-type transport system large permease protein|uniref:TRAP transporter large permease subunit n=1 Tax=Metabacillus rhizolycopersici TaxID=2875709 RepID=A0ABS7UZJ3_9BACI|nr:MULTISPECIES: TRAP transporter large permease subunit [Metabacillus]MBZ5753551.1 TRAP transporter large permease subunit [Metabacillus rhizolycopersici]MCM3652861.1 TRAP transporter large permease subunit [Metabacillus litoralis]
MTMVIFLVVLLAAMAIGIPIAFALLLSGVFMMAYLGDFDTQILSQNLMVGADSFAMMAIPFFILCGDLMNRGGLTKRIIIAATTLVGHIRGGLGYVAILAILLFASLVGSAVASTAALGAILIPMMAKAGYNRDRSTALIAAGNIVSPIMPPSVPMILFGVTAGVSITKLFVAGIAPAIYIAIALAVTWAWVARKDKVEKMPRASFKQMVKSIVDAIWAILMPIGILTGLRGGFFTPTEAGVIAVVYALFIGVFVYKELSLKEIMESLISSAKTTSVIMFLAAAAMVSAWLMTVGNIPEIVSSILSPLIDSPLLLLLVINLIVILVGMAMDVNPTILILTPVLMPVVTAAGIDPVYFGLLFILNNVIGLLTPPVGTVLNVAAGAGKISIGRLVKAIMPFLIVEIVLLFLLIFVPELVTVPTEFFSGE